ncbi:unnamed protein product, partial [Hymenolepis diminuta]
MKNLLMEFTNIYVSILLELYSRFVNNLNFFEIWFHTVFAEWPIWFGLFGIFYKISFKCTTFIFIKSASEWISWEELKERMNPLLCGMA